MKKHVAISLALYHFVSCKDIRENSSVAIARSPFDLLVWVNKRNW